MLSLPLAKLSTAQDATLDETKFTWTHETQDLTLIIQSYGANSSPSQLLKVAQGTQIRHLIEVERLINEGNDLLRTMQEHGVELKHEQLPISALVRSPLIAFRWQLPDKKIRRLQLKFKTSSDYDIAHSHFSQLGLRMTATNTTQSRPSSSASTALPSASVSSNVPHSLVAQSAGPSCPPSRLTEISSRPYTAVTAPTSIESQVQEAAHARPASSYTGRGVGALNRKTSFSGPLRPPEYFARPNSATSAILDLSASAYSPKDQSLMPIDENRPNFTIHPDTAEASLPPRRELPFQRLSMPRSAGSDGSRPSSRPSTSLMGPPPLPQRVADLHPASSRAANSELELPPLPRPTLSAGAQQQPSWMEQPPRTPNQDQSPPPSSQASPNMYEDKENRPPSSSSSNFSPLSYKRPTNKSLSTGPLSNLGDVALESDRTEFHSALSTPPTSSTFHQPQMLTETRGGIQLAGGDLTDYAMQAPEDRRAGLNEFIFENLYNNNFITLVEDMEVCWGRVGLGTK